MKITVVPAQITTVEDRVAGNFGFSQLILFAIPVFGGSLLFAVLPPSMEASLYKIIIVCTILVLSCILAIRVKSKIILFWLVTLLRYNMRSRLYLFDKNTDLYREDYPNPPTLVKEKVALSDKSPITSTPRLGFAEKAKLYSVLDNSASKLRFEMTKKGGLNVHITEIQE